MRDRLVSATGRSLFHSQREQTVSAYGIIKTGDKNIEMEWDEYKNTIIIKNGKENQMHLSYDQLRELRCMIEFIVSDRYRRYDKEC